MSILKNSEIFSALEGEWRIERSISNTAQLKGMAQFTMTDEGHLHYHEQGELCLPDGQSLTAQKTYRFHQLDDGFAVFFDEAQPRLFHHIHLALNDDALTGSAQHLCGDDLYESIYTFHSDDSFTIAHTVTGPRKAYHTMTSYSRSN